MQGLIDEPATPMCVGAQDACKLFRFQKTGSKLKYVDWELVIYKRSCGDNGNVTDFTATSLDVKEILKQSLFWLIIILRNRVLISINHF